MSRTDKILEERGQVYGPFIKIAGVSQEFKRTLESSPKYRILRADQVESLELILHKIARIICGDPDHVDSWDDISGYAQLVVKRLTQAPEPVSQSSSKSEECVKWTPPTK